MYGSRGSLNISQGNGWFCIKCHLSISMFFKFGTMTVEIVWQRVESFCAFPIFVWELPSYLLFRASSRDKACFEFSNVPLKHSFWRVCPGKPESFSFDKTFFYKRTLGDNCWSVALKCFSCEWFACDDTWTLNFFMRYSWLSTIFFVKIEF